MRNGMTGWRDCVAAFGFLPALRLCILVSAVIAFPEDGFAAVTEALAVDEPQPVRAGSGVSTIGSLGSFEFYLALIILGFGAILVAAEFFLLRAKASTSEDVLRVFGLTLIVLGTLFVITAGFSAQQIAPALGLFGTVAGYLLGRKSDHDPGQSGK